MVTLKTGDKYISKRPIYYVFTDDGIIEIDKNVCVILGEYLEQKLWHLPGQRYRTILSIVLNGSINPRISELILIDHIEKGSLEYKGNIFDNEKEFDGNISRLTLVE